MANYVLNESKMFSDIADGIAIVINSETGIYYGMNPLGTEVFARIIGGASSEAVLASLKSIAGVPANIDENFKLFVDALVEKGLIVAGGDGKGGAAINSKIATAENFALFVTEYNDAQELLLADPIHEVKDDTGWTPEKSALETDAEKLKAKKAKEEEMGKDGAQ